MTYRITNDDCSIVEGSHPHEDFAAAYEEASQLARDLEGMVYIVHSNGKQSWEVYSDGEISPLPNEPHALLKLTVKGS